jgi:hypothetical protein
MREEDDAPGPEARLSIGPAPRPLDELVPQEAEALWF